VEPTLECEDDQVVRACDGGVLLVGSCNCQGNLWACSIDAGIPPDYPDTGFVPSCPKWWSIGPCARCDVPGMFCPGGHSCAGIYVTDTLECINGLWQDVAPGVCDAGPPDAGFD